MVLPILFLWKQLNGPQITALANVIFQYWKDMFDDPRVGNKGILDYLNTLTPETANEDHLTFLGILAKLARPIISIPSGTSFYFTEDYRNPSPTGFGYVNAAGGGKFTDTNEHVSGEGETTDDYLDINFFRQLLLTWIHSTGEIGSLQLLDDICNCLYALDVPDEIPSYTFHFIEEGETSSQRSEGDIYINLGQAADWNHPLYIYETLRVIAQAAFSPLPEIFVSLDAAGQVVKPVITPVSGSYTGPQTITIVCDDPVSAQIYYTTDGTSPTSASTPYEGPFTISESCTIKAIGLAEYYLPSDIATAIYILYLKGV